jgi:hypothetical protein
MPFLTLRSPPRSRGRARPRPLSSTPISRGLPRPIKGLDAKRYENLTECRLSAESVDDLLLSDIDAFAKNLTARLPAWRRYPEPAQQALFDMAYNLGVGGLLECHKVLAACASGA